MNQNTETPTPEISADDPRMGAAIAVRTVRDLVDNVAPDQLDLPTPSGDYTVRELLGHLVCAFEQLEKSGRMDPNVEWSPMVVPGIPDDGYGARLEQAAHDIMERWSDDSLLGQMVSLEWAVMPGAHVVGMYTGEFLTHGWDLAVATGQQIEWPNDVAAAALAGSKMGLPAEPRGGDVPFDPPVILADDAPAIEQLVAWSGRDPKGWPSAVS